MNHRVELLEENMKRCSHSVAEAKASLAVLTQDNARLTDRLAQTGFGNSVRTDFLRMFGSLNFRTGQRKCLVPK